jgi:hypothetical protein
VEERSRGVAEPHRVAPRSRYMELTGFSREFFL